MHDIVYIIVFNTIHLQVIIPILMTMCILTWQWPYIANQNLHVHFDIVQFPPYF